VTSPASDAAQPADAADGQGEPGSSATRREKRFEVVAVILLALTAVATAWSGYQASLWDGIQSSNYTQASGARTNAAQKRSEANQFRLADLSVFENHIDAVIDGDDALAEFYRARFRDEFAVAYEAWLALDPLESADAPASPLAMPEYRLAADEEAAALEAQADTLFAEGEDANTTSDVYTLTTLLFAVVLFFAAISERFEHTQARTGLIALGAVGLVVGATIALSQPVTFG
jgi:hypothetical protein